VKAFAALGVWCLALYEIDALWFDGWYFASLNHVISEVYFRW
jgi:hypothetical protein